MARAEIVPGIIVAMLSSMLFGCSLLTPLPRETSLEDRLAAIPTRDLPIDGEVVIHWDDHQIPFIEASSDRDLAFALGMVHAHLRLGQMEMLRRVSQGRIAEMAGPLATDIDHSLRILNFARAVPDIEAALPTETRAWLEAFVRGINHYQAGVARLPLEYSVFNLAREPWTVADVLTLGRLAATDVNWLVWFQLLKLRGRPDWAERWPRLLEAGSASLPNPGGGDRAARLARLLGGFSRPGTNALVVSAGRSASGAALIANDPHLGIMLPNLWLIAGYKSPSYHAVGQMIPGLPFIAVGRNPRIAWGGTNMRAASSDLYDVSALAPGEIIERRETIRVRWWFDRSITVRETKWGPVLSDAPALDFWDGPPFALRWMGHEASDEITAMLKANRARDWREFRDAFKTFAVSGQNMLYADVDGNIGQVLAVRLPVRNGSRPRDLIRDARDGDAMWNGRLGAADLPVAFNPPRGFLVSANNRPPKTEVPIGYFFPPEDRVERMTGLLGRAASIGIDDLKAIQRDVYMASAVKLRDLLVEKIAALGLEEGLDAKGRDAIERLRAWDGHYRKDSRGALAFELVVHYFTNTFHGRGHDENQTAIYAGFGRFLALLADDIERAQPEALADALRDALGRAARRVDDFADWGEMHRLSLTHPLSWLPLIGSRYRFGDHPIGGSSHTVMKTVHRSTDKRHATRYGSNARYISDLKDMDRNYFVLLGGQDGWFRSSTFLDQVPLWLEDDYVQVPLRPSTVRATFARKTVLIPKGAAGSGPR
ncbi:MAG: penicillin acylase family protein [Alphaproteobacteria bacterium]